MEHFGTLMFTADVVAEQARHGSDKGYAAMLGKPPLRGLGPDERAFAARRAPEQLAMGGAGPEVDRSFAVVEVGRSSNGRVEVSGKLAIGDLVIAP